MGELAENKSFCKKRTSEARAFGPTHFASPHLFTRGTIFSFGGFQEKLGTLRLPKGSGSVLNTVLAPELGTFSKYSLFIFKIGGK